MGVVYRARHRDLHRVVALKMILSARFASQEELLRFRLEGETAARLQHPNIVQVYEVGSYEGQPYLVLEYIEGGSLANKLQGQCLSAGEAARLIEVLARAVQVAHNHGIIHRDLKPANVLLTEEGAPKITDFGLAKHLDREPNAVMDRLRALVANESPQSPPRDRYHDLTETGRVLGTPAYMAPEQASGRSRHVGPHTDVYALGAILYELLCGRPPFQTMGAADTLLQVVIRDPSPLRRLNKKVPRDLETICSRCLEKEPAKRYPSASELADDLARFLENKPIHARPVGAIERLGKWTRRHPVVAGLLACLLLVTVLGFAGVTGALLYALQGWREADQQQRRAEQQRETAEQERTVAQGERTKAQRERTAAVAAQARESEERKRANRARIQAETHLTFSRLAQAEQMWQLNKLEGSAARLRLIDKRHRFWEWHRLNNLHHGELFSWSRPQMISVSGVAFSPDGTHLAVASGNPYQPDRDGRFPSELSIWNADTGTLVRILGSFPQYSGSVSYSRNGKALAACSAGGTIGIWSLETGRLLRTFAGKTWALADLAWSPDGVSIAGLGPGGRAVIWNLATGKPDRHLHHQGDGPVRRIAWSPDGRYLATAAGNVRLSEAATGREVSRLEIDAKALSFSPDSTVLAVAAGSVVRLYNVPQGRSLSVCSGHSGMVSSVAFSPDGRLLVTGGADTTVRIWSVEDGQELSCWRGHHGRVECVSFHPNGRVVASGSAQPGDVRLWDLTRLQQYVSLPGGGGWIDSLVFSRNGEDVITQRKNGCLEVRDARTGLLKLCHQLPISSRWHTPGVMGLFGADARVLIATPCNAPNRARAWDVTTGKPLPGTYRHDEKGEIWNVAVDKDGTLAASSARDKRRDVYECEDAVWEIRTGKVRLRIEESLAQVMALVLSPDGRWLARAVTDLASRQTTKYLRTMGIGCRVDLWEVPASGQAQPTEPWLRLWPDESVVQSLAFRSDGKLLATCSPGGRVHLWQLPSGRRLHDHRALVGPIGLEGLAFSPDGRLLAGASRTEIIVWDVNEGEAVLSQSGSGPRSSDQGFSPRIAWSPDGRRLAATNWTHTVSVWEALDLAHPRAFHEQRQAARQRAPRWYLENAWDAFRKGQRRAVDFHLRQIERTGPLPAGWCLRRGELLANLGQWEKAALDYASALDASDGHAAPFWYQHVLLQARAGKHDACRKLAARLFAHLNAETDAESLASYARACCVLPGLLVKPDRLVAMLQEPPLRDKATQDAAPYRHPLALTCLRAKQHEEAIHHAERSLQIAGSSAAQNCANWLVLALACHHRSSKEQAAKWWDKAQTWLAGEEKKPASAAAPVPAGVSCWDWLWLLLLRDEARAALGHEHNDA
jgi:WD40 repeat protein